MLDFKDFKAMISVTDGVNDRDFDPLVSDSNRMMVTDGHALFIYEFSTGTSEKFGVSKEDYLSLNKIKGSKVYFSGNLRIDDTEFKKSEKYFAYNTVDNIIQIQKSNNRYLMPFSTLPEFKCEFVLINKFNALYLSRDLNIVKSVPFDIPEMENTSFGYFCARYVYFKNIFRMFKYFKIYPKIYFGSNTLYFESPVIKGLLSLYCMLCYGDKNWGTIKGE